MCYFHILHWSILFEIQRVGKSSGFISEIGIGEKYFREVQCLSVQWPHHLLELNDQHVIKTPFSSVSYSNKQPPPHHSAWTEEPLSWWAAHNFKAGSAKTWSPYPKFPESQNGHEIRHIKCDLKLPVNFKRKMLEIPYVGIICSGKLVMWSISVAIVL